MSAAIQEEDLYVEWSAALDRRERKTRELAEAIKTWGHNHFITKRVKDTLAKAEADLEAIRSKL